MGDPIQEAIRELEDEVRQIQQAIYFLKQRAGRQSTNGATQRPTPRDPDLFGQPAFAKLTNEDAVDAILKDAGRALTISEIVSEGTKRGKELNPNSIRWVVGKEGDKYRKHNVPDSNAKAYSLKESVEA